MKASSEEHAQEEQSARFLTRLDDTTLFAVKEIVDHLDIEELLWQNDRRARELRPEETTRWKDSPGSDDIFETNEEGTEFIAPVKPPPEEQ